MAMSAGTPRPSWYCRRTRWPGPFGATMMTSTFFGGLTVLKWMAKPWEKSSVLPLVRCGSMSFSYTLAMVRSGTAMKITSAFFTASAVVRTSRPYFFAASIDLLPGRGRR